MHEDCRELALENLVTLTESASAMVRKFPTFTERVIPLCLQVRGCDVLGNLTFILDTDDDGA